MTSCPYCDRDLAGTEIGRNVESINAPMPCGWPEPEAASYSVDGELVPAVEWEALDLHGPITADEAEALGAALIRAASEARRL